MKQWSLIITSDIMQLFDVPLKPDIALRDSRTQWVTYTHTNARARAHTPPLHTHRKLLCGIMEKGTKQNYWKYDRL